MESKKDYFEIYFIQKQPNQKPRWIRSGRAFVNQDRSINLAFTTPVLAGLDFQLRQPLPKTDTVS